MERQMYKITETNSRFQVVYALNGGETIVRVVNSFADHTEAQRLLSELAGWRF
jgi:hypothetical protein